MLAEGMEEFRSKAVWYVLELDPRWHDDDFPPLLHPATASHLIISAVPLLPRYELVGSKESGDVRRIWGVPPYQGYGTTPNTEAHAMKHLYRILLRDGVSRLKKLEFRVDLMYWDRSRDGYLPRDEKIRKVCFEKFGQAVEDNSASAQLSMEATAALETFSFSGLEPDPKIRSTLTFFALELRGFHGHCRLLLSPDLQAQIRDGVDRLEMQMMGGDDRPGFGYSCSHVKKVINKRIGITERFEFRRR